MVGGGERFQIGFISLLSKPSSNFKRGIKRRVELVEGVERKARFLSGKSPFMGTRNREEVFPVNTTIHNSPKCPLKFYGTGH